MRKKYIYGAITAFSILLLASGCDRTTGEKNVSIECSEIEETQTIMIAENESENQMISNDDWEENTDSLWGENVTYTVPDGYKSVSFSENSKINAVFIEADFDESCEVYSAINVWDKPEFIMEVDASTLQYHQDNKSYEYVWSGSSRLENTEGEQLVLAAAEAYLTEGNYQLFTDAEKEELIKKGGYLVSDDFGERQFYCAYLYWPGHEKRILVGMNKTYFSKEDCISFLNTIELPEEEERVLVKQSEEWALNINYFMPEGHKAVNSFDVEGNETIILLPEEIEYTDDLNQIDCGIYGATVIMEAAPIELCVFEEGILKNAGTDVNAVEVMEYEAVQLGNESLLFGEARALKIDKSFYNELMEQGIQLSENELFQQHWCAFFAKEDGERAMMVLLNKDYFSKEKAVEWLQQMQLTEKSLYR